MKSIGLGIFTAAFICAFSPAQAEEGTLAPNKTSELRIMETPMEPLLPCTESDELIVYTLKAEDQKNIQVAIECRNGTFIAKWPPKDAKTIKDVEGP